MVRRVCVVRFRFRFVGGGAIGWGGWWSAGDVCAGCVGTQRCTIGRCGRAALPDPRCLMIDLGDRVHTTRPTALTDGEQDGFAGATGEHSAANSIASTIIANATIANAIFGNVTDRHDTPPNTLEPSTHWDRTNRDGTNRRA